MAQTTPIRILAMAIAASSAGAMAYVGLYQAGAVKRLICPLLGDGCRQVADAPFARPFGVPDGFIALGLYALIFTLLAVSPAPAPLRVALVVLAALAAIGNAVGVYDMARLGAFCFWCALTTVLSPLLLWAAWKSS